MARAEVAGGWSGGTDRPAAPHAARPGATAGYLVNVFVAAACAAHKQHLLLPTPLPSALMSPQPLLAALFGAGRPTSAASEGPCLGRLRSSGIRLVARPFPDRPPPPPNRAPPLPGRPPPTPNRAVPLPNRALPPPPLRPRHPAASSAWSRTPSCWRVRPHDARPRRPRRADSPPLPPPLTAHAGVDGAWHARVGRRGAALGVGKPDKSLAPSRRGQSEGRVTTVVKETWTLTCCPRPILALPR
jgi:hypothetical protein